MSRPASTGARTIASRVVVRGREVGIAMVYEIVSMISMLIVFPITARSLGPEIYGEYTTLYVFAGLGIVWVYSGVGAALLQLIMQVERSAGSLVRLARHQVIVTSAVSAAIGTLAAVTMFGSGILIPALLVFGSELMLAGFAQLNISVVWAIDGVKVATMINIVRPLLRTVGVVALAFGGAVSLLNLVIINVVATAILLAVSMVAARRHITGNVTSPTTHGELARYSAYYSTSMSTGTIQEEGDKIVMAATRPPVELGEYMVAYRVVSTLSLPFRAVIAAAARWFLPKDPRVGGQVTRTARMSVPTALYGLACAAGILIFGDLIRLLVGSGFEDAVRIATWLSLVPLFHGLTQLPFMGLLGLGRNRERMWLGMGTAVIATVSYLILVPRFGWQGAVIATYITDVVTLLTGWAMLLRYQRQADAAQAR
jgi:O-antigen/teichoic acid export membrane protein